MDKSQTVRLIDVFVLGPWLLYLATEDRKFRPAERFALGVTGALTIWYNGRNYIATARADAAP